MKHFVLCSFLLVPAIGYSAQESRSLRGSSLFSCLFSRCALQEGRRLNLEKRAEERVMSEQELHAALDKLLQELPEGSTVTRADLLQYGSWFLYGCMQCCEGLAQMFRMMYRGTELMRTWSDYMPWA